ncbi:hypothetical protein GCM10027511_23410 [Hymenobacter humi]
MGNQKSTGVPVGAAGTVAVVVSTNVRLRLAGAVGLCSEALKLDSKTLAPSSPAQTAALFNNRIFTTKRH